MGGKRKKSTDLVPLGQGYQGLVGDISELLDQARRSSARAVNNVLTATYWEVGRRVVEFEQGGSVRAGYGDELLGRLAHDLTKRFGRGFSRQGLQKMRSFYLGWEICPTPSSKLQARVRDPKATGSPATTIPPLPTFHADLFPLPWSHYVRLLSVPNHRARAFYEQEAVRGGWSVRQLDRQISTQFYERLSGSERKGPLLAKAHAPQAGDVPEAEELIRDPYLLEFLNLKDEYGESELEAALVRHLETFLLELGAGFTFVARQKRILIDAVWYRMDLLLFHRRLRCLVVIDLKIGKFTPADAGQMNLYLNYAKDHLCEPGENPPVGLILCSEKSDTVVKYATGGINAQVFASRYLTDLPTEKELREEVERTKRALTSGSDNLGPKGT